VIRRGLAISVWLVLGMVGLAPGLLAQEQESPFSGQRVIGFEPDREQKIALARRLISAQRFQEAADLLEIMYESEPDNGLVQNLLRTCYDQLKQYDKAELLMRRIIERDPRSAGHRLYLAELLARLDRKDEALEVYDQAAAMIEESDPVRFLILIKSLTSSGMDQAALDRIDQARAKFADPTLFAIERGGIFEKRQEYKKAVMEYLPPLVQDSTPDADRAESRLLALLEFQASSVQVEELLRAVADSTSGLRTMRLLADHYLKAGRFDDAFWYTLRQDSLEGHSGMPLLSFTRRCQERRCWPQVVRMTEVILRQYADSRYQLEASLDRAQALAELGRADEAVQVYRNLADRSADTRTRADAIYGIGVLYSEYLGDNEQALIYYDSVINHYPRGQGYLAARKAAPLCHLREGRLDTARRQLAEFGQGLLPDDLQEELSYLRALVEFFDKKYDTAETMFRKVTVDHPQGFYVNDALRLILAITDARGLGSTLDEYSGAVYARYRGQTDSARTQLYSLADGQPPVLADLALYELIQLELKRADSAAALQVIDRLYEEHPESYYRPLGVKVKADLLVDSGRDIKQGIELYRFLLENYSEYPFTREVREKLRKLETRVPTS